MSQEQSTTVVYELTGSTRRFIVPFEYLSRQFVVVTVLAAGRTVLTLGSDYRFISLNEIETTVAYGGPDGNFLIEIRRVTSATDRLVEFADGSVLRSRDMNLSAIQTIHIAEEARNLSATLETNAKASEVSAKASEVSAKASELAAEGFAAEAEQSAQAAAQSASQSDVVSLRQELANPDMGAAMVARGVVAVDSIADLLALPEGQRKEGLRYLVKGYHSGSDVGGGEFYWDATSEEVDNGGTVFGDAASGRWKRNKDYTDAFMFGAIPDGAVSATDALMRAAEYTASRGETLYLRRGQYLFDGPAIDLESFRVIGDSGAEIVGDTSVTFCRLRGGLHIEGLTFSGIHSVFYNTGLGTQENLADITITNNIIKNCMRFGMHRYSTGVISNIDRLTITANKVLGCGNGVAISAVVTDALIESNILLDTGFELSGGAAIRCIQIGIDPADADPIVLNQGGSGVVRGNTVRRFGSNDKGIDTHAILVFGNFFNVTYNHIEENIGSSDNKIRTHLHGIYLKGSGNVVSSNTLLNSANAGGAICIKPLWDAPTLHIDGSRVNNIVESNNIEFKEDYYPEYRLTAIRTTGRGASTISDNHVSGCRGSGITVAGDNSLVSNNNITDYKGHSGSTFSTALSISNSLRSVVSGNAIECRQIENSTIAISVFFNGAIEGQDAPLSLSAQGNTISGFSTGASARLTAFQVSLNELPAPISRSGLIRLDANTLSTGANVTGRMYNVFGPGKSVEAFVAIGNVVNALGGTTVSSQGLSANTEIHENNVGVTTIPQNTEE